MNGFKALLLSLSMLSPATFAYKHSPLEQLQATFTNLMEPAPVRVQGKGEIEVAFSPNEGAEQLIIKAIDSANHSIRLLSYSFTSARVTQALLRAKNNRRVDVAMVVDYRNNFEEDKTGKARAALNSLAAAGVPIRVIKVYPWHHDKAAVIDGMHVQTGSANYSEAAARRNSENVLVIWNNPELAALYLKHWQRNWNQGLRYSPSY